MCEKEQEKMRVGQAQDVRKNDLKRAEIDKLANVPVNNFLTTPFS